MMKRKFNVSNLYWKTLCFDIKTVELEGPESSRRKKILMNFITLAVYLLFVLPLPPTLATGAVSFERHCQRYISTGCPVHDRDSWVCSKNITNCLSPDYPYHCILNTAVTVVHVCAAAQICPNGTVPIFDPMTRMVSCKNRSKEYFQPDDIWSNNIPICKEKFGCDINIHKIECTVEPEKEQNQDTLCRCDVRNDYILSFKEGREICVPGKFAILKCPDPDGQERLRNYTCVPRCEEGFQRNDNDICVLESTVTTTLGDKAKPSLTASTDTVIIVTVVMLVVVAVCIIVIVLCCKRKACCRQSTTAQSDDPEPGTMSNESCIRRLCNCQYRQVPTDNNDANTAEVVSTNNAQTDAVELGTTSNGTNTHSQARDRPNQETPSPVPTDNDANTAEVVSTNNAQTDAVELGTTSNAQTDDPEAGTMSNETNENAASREGRNQGTNTNAQPRDIPNRETPRPETNENAASREGRNQEKLHRTVLKRCLPVLVNDLNFSTVMIFIQQKGIVDYITLRDITEQATTTEKINMLLEKIMQKPKDKYEEFKECLVEASQEDLKKILEKKEEEVMKEIREKHQAQDTG